MTIDGAQKVGINNAFGVIFGADPIERLTVATERLLAACRDYEASDNVGRTLAGSRVAYWLGGIAGLSGDAVAELERRWELRRKGP